MSKIGRFIALSIAPFGLLLLLAGCSKSEDSTGTGGSTAAGGATATTGGDAQSSAALATFKANCANCHALGGEGRGKDLSHTGAEHDQAWIADFIKHPKAQRMPSFDGKIPDADIQTLAGYLASQK